MSKVVRSVKNVTKGYSSVQVKVRNATSNDPWGPTGLEMSEIAQMTFNNSNDFYEIMDMLDKRLNDKGKNWRHVLKSLKVLDYCLHEGSELVVTWAKKNIYVIKTLREFQYMEDESRDVGQNVRVSAKELTALIMDDERLRVERADRKSWKSRVTGINENGPDGSVIGGFGESSHQRGSRRRPGEEDDNDLEYKLALEASKNEMEEEKRRRQSKDGSGETDDDIAKAIKLSKEEEDLRRRELENQNANLLFDDTPTPTQQQQQPQYTGWNQGYQQGGAVDLFGNPVYQQQQQPQNTGFLENAYSQQQFQQQPTGFQNGFQPGLEQFQQQPQQQFMQPQQTAFNTNNPYGQQGNDMNQFQQPQQQMASPAPGSHNPWATQQPQADAMRPLPTGSNNPFASKVSQPPPQRSQTQPTLTTLAEQRTATQFNQTQNPNPILNYSAPQPQQQQVAPIQQPQNPQKPMNPQHERLNQLLASGDGMDTFGNTGDLRIPAQHTAPGTFVNSAGQNLNKLHAAQTGNNPFFSQQQTGFGAVQQNRVAPAQTGPPGQFSGAFGGGNNPFGGQQQQQQQHGAAGGSLIDF